jgi:hypothetical protein
MSIGQGKIFLLLLGALAALPASPRRAEAQSTSADATWVELDVTAALNRTIDASRDSLELREKVVRRFAECSLMYGGLSTLASNAEAKKNYVQAQLATGQIETALARPVQPQRRLELEKAAQTSVALMLRTVKTQGNKEITPLLKSCKALNDPKQIAHAVGELSAEP